MNKRFLFIIFVCVIVVTSLFIKSCDKSLCEKNGKNSKVAQPVVVEQNFTPANVVLLGAVQGVTEFLPVSSTGHMILVEHFFNSEKNLAQSATKQEAINAYFVIIQSGSILAILILYWRRIREMFLACFFCSKRGGFLIKNLLLSFFPAGLLGFVLNKTLQSALYNPFCIACALIIGAMLMLFAEKWYSKKSEKFDEIEHLSTLTCVKIGLWQCLALIPGMSRSMSTIVGGYFCNMSKKSAAEYSFLLGFVTLSAATAFKLYTDHDILAKYFDAWTFFGGIFVAFIFSALTIRLFISYLNKHGLALFAWYRVVLGICVLFLLK